VHEKAQFPPLWVDPSYA